MLGAGLAADDLRVALLENELIPGHFEKSDITIMTILTMMAIMNVLTTTSIMIIISIQYLAILNIPTIWEPAFSVCKRIISCLSSGFTAKGL